MDRASYSYRTDPATPPFPDDRPLFVFDGDCALCSHSAQFVLRRDRRAAFRFAAVQTPLGRALFVHYGLDPDRPQSNIVLADGRAWLKSDAVLELARRLGLPWSLACVARFAPRSWRDTVYDVIARNRIQLFGARDVCYLAEPGSEDRFLS